MPLSPTSSNPGSALAVATAQTVVASGGTLGFYGSAGTVKPTITGAKGANVALGSLLAALAAFGLLTDSTTA